MTTTNEPVRIRFAFGTTVNLGNFENVRAECEIEDSVRESETIHDASVRIRGKVQVELLDALRELEDEISKMKKVNKRGG